VAGPPAGPDSIELQPEYAGGSEAQRGEVVSGELVVTHCVALEILEPAVKALDDITSLISLLVTNALLAI
jgi:hypothetical protein